MIDKKGIEYFNALMHMLMSIIGSAAIGFFLEKLINAKGLIMIISIILGVIIGFIVLQKKITSIDKKI